ncbi:MAG: hypothetical protein ACKO35_11505 [Planctomycetaceae bacterium]
MPASVEVDDPVPAILTSVLLLGLLVGVGVVVIVMIRARWLEPGEDRGGWEKTLVDYRNLRDTGVLSEEEYRKIKTLVEPRVRIGTPDTTDRQRSAGDSAGPELERK